MVTARSRLPSGILVLLALAAGCLSAGFGGLVTFGAIGGAAIGIAPEWTFAQVKPLICAGDAQLEFFAVRRTYHRPGEAEPHLECVAPDGARRNVLLPGIAAVLGGAFLIVFVATLVMLLIPAAVLIWLARRTQREPASR